MRLDRSILPVALLAGALVVLPAQRAQAQGRSHEHNPHGAPPGQARRHWSTDDATDVSRDVLGRHGYEVVRIERDHDVRIVYFRRKGRKHRHDRVERMWIRPDHDRVIVERAPSAVQADIRIRLGF